MNKKQQKYLDQIESGLLYHYKRDCIIRKEFERAKECINSDKEYFLKRKLYWIPPASYKCFAIWFENDSYHWGTGWEKSKINTKNYN